MTATDYVCLFVIENAVAAGRGPVDENHQLAILFDASRGCTRLLNDSLIDYTRAGDAHVFFALPFVGLGNQRR